MYSLLFPLGTRFAAALIAFVVHTINMVPKHNAPGQLPAYTAFRGRAPSYKIDAPYAFGTTGFLQRAAGPLSNTAAPRADYCIWLGSTRNLKGTHRCFSLATLTGDTFRPAATTQQTIGIMRKLAGTLIVERKEQPHEQPLPDPDSPYPLDPNRGVLEDDSSCNREESAEVRLELVQADPSPLDDNLDQVGMVEMHDASEPEVNHSHDENDSAEAEMHDASEPEVNHSHDENDSTEESRDNENIQSEVILLRNEMNNGYNLRKSTMVKHVYATLNVKTASSLFGGGVVKDAVTLELTHCLTKGVFMGRSPTESARDAIPSTMFLTPKKLPSGALDKIKARLEAGGHRQDRSLYTDQETSSPTVSLKAVFAQATIAAQRGDHVLTLDHKAAYLNATMKEPAVKMILSKEVSSALCEIDEEYKAYLRGNGTILVQLQKALYGCIQ
jgi:hypothetical protein